MTPFLTLCLALADQLRDQAADPAVVSARDAERKRRQEVARDHLKTWSTRAVTPPTFVSQEDYAARLLQLIYEPHLIRQTGFEVCGPNAILAAVLHDYPDDAVKFATTLFEAKVAMLGKVSLSLTPSVCAQTLNEIEAGCRAVKKEAPPGADWILFSAAQNNLQSGYTGLPDGVSAGPVENRRLLQATKLYGDITIPRTSSSLDSNWEKKRDNDSQLIIVFLDSSLISSAGADFILSANHLVYVEQVKPYEFEGEKCVQLTLYSWGERMSQTFRVADFMDGVQGYLLGKRSY